MLVMELLAAMGHDVFATATTESRRARRRPPLTKPDLMISMPTWAWSIQTRKRPVVPTRLSALAS